VNTNVLYSTSPGLRDSICIAEYMPDGPSFSGCVKAYLMAERQHMALNSYIAQQDFTE